MKNFVYQKLLGGRDGAIGALVLAVLLFLVFPSTLEIFRLNNVGRFLSLAFVALGLVLCWGYGGILSLGQGIFFGAGGYCMAAFLKLEAAAAIALEPDNPQTTKGIPDFMDWNQVTELPWFWAPFNSLPATLLLIILVPLAISFFIGVALFKRRVSGVYFAIITQILVWMLTLGLLSNQWAFGGENGITDLRTMLGWSIQTDSAKFILYFVTAALLFVCIFASRLVLVSKYGKMLVAMRDAEDRVRFSGYDVANLKVFVFCLAAVITSIGGAMYVLNYNFISPRMIGIEPSIYMVIYCAVGGRLSLLGAVYGTLLVLLGRTFFSEEFPALWYFLLGSLFVGVTLFFPLGLAGIYDSHIKPKSVRFIRWILNGRYVEVSGSKASPSGSYGTGSNPSASSSSRHAHI